VNKYPALRGEPSQDGSEAQGSDSLGFCMRMRFKSSCNICRLAVKRVVIVDVTNP